MMLRALVYTLNRKGIKAKQWNMQGPRNAHAAVIVYGPNDQNALVDPYYGFSGINNGTIRDPLEVQKALRNGTNIKSLLTAYGPDSNWDFYKGLGQMAMGAQGEPFTISVEIPKVQKTLTLGAINGSQADTRGALLKEGMSITWEYAGNKYDYKWKRELIAPQPVCVKIILTKAPDQRILDSFSPTPQVDGTILTWYLLKNEKITSEDGIAAVSPISKKRRSHYIDIDQIIITPVKKD